jgi:hypothetical protein
VSPLSFFLPYPVVQEGSGRLLAVTDAAGYSQAGGPTALEPGTDVQHDHEFSATISLDETYAAKSPVVGASRTHILLLHRHVLFARVCLLFLSSA